MNHSCAVRKDGSLVYWGEDASAERHAPPKGEFTTVAAGDSYDCALRKDGAAVCWGTVSKIISQ
ncbi:MAG: RCC1 domain-containing protein [Pseudomonadota bacterium]